MNEIDSKSRPRPHWPIQFERNLCKGHCITLMLQAQKSERGRDPLFNARVPKVMRFSSPTSPKHCLQRERGLGRISTLPI